MVLAGNKRDLHNISVPRDQALEFAKANACLFYETSAKAGSNVVEMFTDVGRGFRMTHSVMISYVKVDNASFLLRLCNIVNVTELLYNSHKHILMKWCSAQPSNRNCGFSNHLRNNYTHG
jgi:hypothetical protein